MGTCKVCKTVASATVMVNGICPDCRDSASDGTNKICLECGKPDETGTMVQGVCNSCIEQKKEKLDKDKTPSAIAWLVFASWVILLLSLVGAGVAFTLELSFAGQIAVSISIILQGVFFSSLGFTVAYIAKNIYKKP